LFSRGVGGLPIRRLEPPPTFLKRSFYQIKTKKGSQQEILRLYARLWFVDTYFHIHGKSNDKKAGRKWPKTQG